MMRTGDAAAQPVSQLPVCAVFQRPCTAFPPNVFYRAKAAFDSVGGCVQCSLDSAMESFMPFEKCFPKCGVCLFGCGCAWVLESGVLWVQRMRCSRVSECVMCFVQSGECEMRVYIIIITDILRAVFAVLAGELMSLACAVTSIAQCVSDKIDKCIRREASNKEKESDSAQERNRARALCPVLVQLLAQLLFLQPPVCTTA